MRKVAFRKWLPANYEITDGPRRLIPGTHQWSDFIYFGEFHQWGSATEDYGESVGTYTIAVIEMPDGSIETPLPSNIKFIDQQ